MQIVREFDGEMMAPEGCRLEIIRRIVSGGIGPFFLFGFPDVFCMSRPIGL